MSSRMGSQRSVALSQPSREPRRAAAPLRAPDHPLPARERTSSSLQLAQSPPPTACPAAQAAARRARRARRAHLADRARVRSGRRCPCPTSPGCAGCRCVARARASRKPLPRAEQRPFVTRVAARRSRGQAGAHRQRSCRLQPRWRLSGAHHSHVHLAAAEGRSGGTTAAGRWVTGEGVVRGESGG